MYTSKIKFDMSSIDVDRKYITVRNICHKMLKNYPIEEGDFSTTEA